MSAALKSAASKTSPDFPSTIADTKQNCFMHKNSEIETKKLERISKRPAARNNMRAVLSRIENNPVNWAPAVNRQPFLPPRDSHSFLTTYK
eukprot:7245895-Pyramimonas_sp.AAC.1